jgi:hypothetical protein
MIYQWHYIIQTQDAALRCGLSLADIETICKILFSDLGSAISARIDRIQP